MLMLSCSVFAQDINSYQPPIPFTNNYVARSGSVNLQNCTGASACWSMDESSGSIIDSIASLTLAQYNGANTYSVGGNSSYGTGITMNPTAGGFNKTTASAALEIGTGDGNVLIDMRIDGTLAAFSEVFVTTIREAGSPGWSFRLITASKNAQFSLIATDTTTVNATWGDGATDAIFNAYTDNLPHKWEFRIDRAGNTVALFLDNVSFGSVSIATLSGKSITSTGAGIGCDYRAGINRNVPITVWFARVKKSVT